MSDSSGPVPGEARDLRDLVDPVVVVAFGGWNDAGNAATDAVEHLEEAYGAEPVYALDPDDFYDFQVNRPQVGLDPDRERQITWPTTEFLIGELPDGRDLVLVQGLEPNMRWRQFSTLIASALSSAYATRVHLLGSLLADTPHTRPIPVSITSQRPGADDRTGTGALDVRGADRHHRRAGRHPEPGRDAGADAVVGHPPLRLPPAVPQGHAGAAVPAGGGAGRQPRSRRADRAGPSLGAGRRRTGGGGLRGGGVRRLVGAAAGRRRAARGQR